MIIKKNSWHYRMNVWKRHAWRVERNKTVCSYFWFTVMTMLRVAVVPLLSYIGLFILGGSLLHDMRVPALDGIPAYWDIIVYPLNGVAFICGILTICAFVIAFFWAVVHTCSWVKKKLNSQPKKEKAVREPGLLASYLKARKEKVCPIIKFEE